MAPADVDPVAVLHDPEDPRLDDVRDLRRVEPKVRERSLEHFVAEGMLAVQRVAAAGHEMRAVYVSEHRWPSVRDDLEGLGLADSVAVLVVDQRCLEEATGYRAHRGVLASATRPPERSVTDVLAGARRCVVVESSGDLENLGAILRTAAALDLGPVLLDPRCADPLYRRCVRVSLGWSAAHPWARAASSMDALAAAEEHGFRTVALTPAARLAVDDAASAGVLDDPVALVVGAEGPGLEPATLAAAAHQVSIPMAGDVDSLNVATSLAVVGAFAAARRGWNSQEMGRQDQQQS